MATWVLFADARASAPRPISLCLFFFCVVSLSHHRRSLCPYVETYLSETLPQVWAIGTGLTATPADAQGIHKYVRSLLKEKYGDTVADGVRIQYGELAPRFAVIIHVLSRRPCEVLRFFVDCGFLLLLLFSRGVLALCVVFSATSLKTILVTLLASTGG